MLSDITTLESTLNRITKSKNSDKEKNILKDEVSNALDKLNNSNFLDKADLEKVKEILPRYQDAYTKAYVCNCKYQCETSKRNRKI